MDKFFKLNTYYELFRMLRPLSHISRIPIVACKGVLHCAGVCAVQELQAHPRVEKIVEDGLACPLTLVIRVAPADPSLLCNEF